MFKRVADEVTAIGRGMQEVEEAVGLRGRKYDGAFDNDGEYRICVQFREGDDPQALGLEVGSLPVAAMRGNVSQESRPASMS